MEIEIDFELGILTVVNPRLYEIAKTIMIFAPIARPLDLSKQIPVSRLVIQREHQMQCTPRKRLPQALRGTYKLRPQRRIARHERGSLGGDVREQLAEVVAPAGKNSP